MVYTIVFYLTNLKYRDILGVKRPQVVYKKTQEEKITTVLRDSLII